MGTVEVKFVIVSPTTLVKRKVEFTDVEQINN